MQMESVVGDRHALSDCWSINYEMVMAGPGRRIAGGFERCTLQAEDHCYWICHLVTILRRDEPNARGALDDRSRASPRKIPKPVRPSKGTAIRERRVILP